MDILIAELIEFVKTASPIVWEIFMRQVYMQAIGYLIWAVALIVAAFGSKKFGDWFGVKEETQRQFETYEVGKWFCYVCAPMFALGVLALLTSMIFRFANPDYYAIQLLLGHIQ